MSPWTVNDEICYLAPPGCPCEFRLACAGVLAGVSYDRV
jgi:hypothetical protein